MVSKSRFLSADFDSSRTYIKFRFIVFRPFIREVLVGKVRSCSREGLRLTVGFFDDIFVPKKYIPTPSEFVQSEGAKGKWVSLIFS